MEEPMNARLPFVFLCALGPLLGACGDRPVLGTGSSDQHAGVAGTAGAAGNAGVAGSAGGAGGDVPLRGGCDVKPLVEKYFCTITGACHDAQGSGAGLDMVTT